MSRSCSVLAAVAVTLATGVAALRAAAPAVGERAGGRWYCPCWEDVNFAAALSRGGFWFFSAAKIWRCDPNTDKLTVFTPLDGLPLDTCLVEHMAAAEDGRCAVQMGGIYLYRPSAGWRRLPAPSGRQVWQIGFGPAGKLHALSDDEIGRPGSVIRTWDGNAWNVAVATPAYQRFVPLSDGFLLHVPAVAGRDSPWALHQPLDGSAAAGYGQPEPFASVMSDMQHRGRTYCLVRQRNKIRTGLVRLYEAAGGRLTAEPNTVALDMRDDCLLTLNAGGDPWDLSYTLVSPRSAFKAPVPAREWNRLVGTVPVRDPRGRLWLGNERLEGETWRVVAPRAADFAPPARAPAPAGAVRPPAAAAVRHLWRQESDRGKNYWRYYEVAGGGQKLLLTMPAPNMVGGPSVPAPDGTWWGAMRTYNETPEKFYAARFEATGEGKIHLYPCERGIAGGFMPQLALSPGGRLWVWTEKHNLRYDPGADKLVADEPWEDFSFAWGDWRLSMAGKVSSFGAAVYVKEGGAWRPLTDPFSHHPVRGTPGMIRGDRMLMAADGVGMLEYNVTTDNWAVLHSSSGFRARFDDAGRRVLIGWRCTLVYDGDPFAPTGQADRAEAEAFSQILKLLDDYRWRVRDKATEELRKNFATFRLRMEAAARRSDLSLEARLRIEQVLKETTGSRPRLAGLFQRMHPPVK